MADSAQRFKARLIQAGLEAGAISAAWPEWWSEAADASPSALAELRFSVARKLGLDPRYLMEDEQPRYFWDAGAKYKHFKGDENRERPAITSFGISVGRMLVRATPSHNPVGGLSANSLRESLLNVSAKNKLPFFTLRELLAFLWAVGIPVIHLRVFPLAAKRMCAMAVNIQGRYAILLARDSKYPAETTFHLAHEIGHIASGHIKNNLALIDMENPEEAITPQDDEELEADRYALELLTGSSTPEIIKQGDGHNAKELAKQVSAKGSENRIEPGTLALCYGYKTKEWATVKASFEHIYTAPISVWEVVNKNARDQLVWDELVDEDSSFLHAVMGGIN